MIHKLFFSSKNLNKQRALFLDRDGVINKKPMKHDYVKSWEEFVFNEGVFDLIRNANEKNFLVIVVTNQRGIARGLMTKNDFEDISNKMVKECQENRAVIDGVYYCPHDYGVCGCRKPKAGLLQEAIKDFGIDPALSIMIGDSNNDMVAGEKIGVGMLVKIFTDNCKSMTINWNVL